MVADGEILLDQPLLSESEDEDEDELLHSEDESEDELLHSEDDSEDEVNEDIYDAEYLMKQRKELVQMCRLLLTMNAIVLAATMVYCILYGVKLPPVPFSCTYLVFGYQLLWVVAIVLFIFSLYSEFDWWRKTRPVVKED